MMTVRFTMRNRYLLVADVLAIMLAAWAAFAYKFGWLFSESRPEFLPFLALAVVIKIGVFFAFGMYRRYWRYASFWDLIAIVLANSAASILLSGVMVGSRLLDLIPTGFSRAVPPLDWLFALALTVGIRATVRAVAETMSTKKPGQPASARNVLIVGAGDAGTMVVREMQRNPQLGLQPVGFLDDDPEKLGKRIYGVVVMGPFSALGTLCARYQIDEVVIALPRAGGQTVRAVADQCRAARVAYRSMPGVFELLDGQVSVSRLRQVEIADLLRRPQVQSAADYSGYLTSSRVLVTGAGGSIGSELCRQIASAGPAELVLLGHGENSVFEIAAELRRRYPDLSLRAVIADVRDARRIEQVFGEVRPQAVFHAAAHKHVPLMEDNPVEAVTNNVGGTRNIVNAAAAMGVQHLVMVSTDKAAGPSNIMGASKRVAELVVQHAARTHGKPYAVVRFGNVLGSRGSVVPIFKQQIAQGGPVTVTHPDVRRYFMTIPEAVHLILQAGGLGRGGELFVLDMGEPVRLRDMAADMIRLSGLSEQDVPITFTGLRPGEKLDEILWEDGARVELSECTGIRRVHERQGNDSVNLSSVVDAMVAAAERHDLAHLYTLIRKTIPSATIRPVTVDYPEAGPSNVVQLPPR